MTENVPGTADREVAVPHGCGLYRAEGCIGAVTICRYPSALATACIPSDTIEVC